MHLGDIRAALTRAQAVPPSIPPQERGDYATALEWRKKFLFTAIAAEKGLDEKDIDAINALPDETELSSDRVALEFNDFNHWHEGRNLKKAS